MDKNLKNPSSQSNNTPSWVQRLFDLFNECRNTCGHTCDIDLCKDEDKNEKNEEPKSRSHSYKEYMKFSDNKLTDYKLKEVKDGDVVKDINLEDIVDKDKTDKTEKLDKMEDKTTTDSTTKRFQNITAFKFNDNAENEFTKKLQNHLNQMINDEIERSTKIKRGNVGEITRTMSLDKFIEDCCPDKNIKLDYIIDDNQYTRFYNVFKPKFDEFIKNKTNKDDKCTCKCDEGEKCEDDKCTCKCDESDKNEDENCIWKCHEDLVDDDVLLLKINELQSLIREQNEEIDLLNTKINVRDDTISYLEQVLNEKDYKIRDLEDRIKNLQSSNKKDKADVFKIFNLPDVDTMFDDIFKKNGIKW